ncbi:MAG: hypothetical protein DRH57_05590 [Candidatus Cloacimonadota bacterium]|nr:MAG: hypothetical protein DRH57_05590 [Candidatus Cloacimonadota bacterium]
MIKKKIAFDTNIYIDILNDKASFSNFINVNTESLYLIAVLLEIEIGAFEKNAKKVIENHKNKLNKLNRILAPSKNAFIKAGRILSIFHEQEHFDLIGLYKITNDVLIATTCLENGVTLNTKNKKDFEKNCHYLKGFKNRIF